MLKSLLLALTLACVATPVSAQIPLPIAVTLVQWCGLYRAYGRPPANAKVQGFSPAQQADLEAHPANYCS